MTVETEHSSDFASLTLPVAGVDPDQPSSDPSMKKRLLFLRLVSFGLTIAVIIFIVLIILKLR